MGYSEKGKQGFQKTHGMRDLISRQAAIDTAMNDSLIINAMDSVKDGDIHRTKRAIVRLLASLPSIDAVQVVQCKDCLFNDGDGPNEDDKYWCALHQSFMQYCSEVERRGEQDG